jgi:serine/threonine protein kinase
MAIFEPGQIFANAFEILELVGRGSFGTVYKARQLSLDRIVALKLLDAIEPEMLARFHREAKLASQLTHEGICACLLFGAEGNTPFMVLEFLNGRTLRAVLNARSALPWTEACHIVLQISQALKTAHDAGVVHRDLKPENIMLTEAGRLKILDFGLAYIRFGNDDQRLTQPGMTLGTVAYMSPEQSGGLPVDARSDIYSLGCLLGELLTGNPPLLGDTISSVMRKRRTGEEAEFPLTNDIPASLNLIVRKALAELPENRYQNADEMAEDLLSVLRNPSFPGQKTLNRKKLNSLVSLQSAGRRRIVLACLGAVLALTSLAFILPEFDRLERLCRLELTETKSDKDKFFFQAKLAMLYHEQKKRTDEEACWQQCVESADRCQLEDVLVAHALVRLSEFDFERNHFAKALKRRQRAYEITLRYGDLMATSNVAKLLAESLEQKGSFKHAEQMYRCAYTNAAKHIETIRNKPMAADSFSGYCAWADRQELVLIEHLKRRGNTAEVKVLIAEHYQRWKNAGLRDIYRREFEKAAIGI